MNNNDIYDTIGKNIKKYRKKNNLTQEQLASRANLSYGFIKNLEAKNVRATISIETLALLATCLEVKLSDLIEESN